jgi:uncharacterized protein with ParB-like and HNH nuclease domain
MTQQATETSSNPDIIRSVSSLLGEKFFIPKYQRGYRWTERQVKDLLDDVNSFAPVTREGAGTSWYCLQPLVVKKNKYGAKWNLVDGQQRLTTIYLILHYLREGLSERRKQDSKLYSLEYETRKGETEWVKVFDAQSEAEKNIDFWHIYTAYQTIKKWFSEGKIDEDKFRGKLSEDCKFIWYDIGQTCPDTTSEEEVFIRLNIGKIPLTNAELIKALFLNRANFKTSNNHEVELRQLEIATQWDMMEEELSDNAFWYFINGKENAIRPRINYLFEIISKKKPSDNDDYATFRHFNDEFGKDDKDGKGDMVKKQWEKIHVKYQILRDWFKDHSYYHRIGYLLTFGTSETSLGGLLNFYSTETKTAFAMRLSKEISETIKWDGQENIEKSDNQGQTKKILLLHNVITMAKQESDNARFPFDKYHKEKWDIEHIQAVADPEKKPTKPEDRKSYLSDAAEFLDKTLKTKIDVFIANEANLKNDNNFDALYNEVIIHFAEEDVESADTNTLSNLALLDVKTNRGYGNDVFPVKRKKILKKDAEGQFIPVCTRNAFMKYYTRGRSDLNRWYMDDRNAYMDDIKTKLNEFFKKGGAK